MRRSAALVLLASLAFAHHADAQDAANPAPDGSRELRDDGAVVIDSPPASALPPTVRSEGVVLQRPGRVLLRGKPVQVEFRSPTDGVAFQLQAWGTYSAISGVSYGVGYGGFGYPGWGWGGYGFGMAPYYGEVVTRAYQPICEAPCVATLLSGKHRMALSRGGGPPVNVAMPIELSENAIVEGRYIDKRKLRRAGWALFVAGTIAGMAMMFASVNYQDDPFNTGDQIRNRGVFYSGVGIFASSIIAGSVLAAQNDEAYVDVFPIQ